MKGNEMKKVKKGGEKIRGGAMVIVVVVIVVVVVVVEVKDNNDDDIELRIRTQYETRRDVRRDETRTSENETRKTIELVMMMVKKQRTPFRFPCPSGRPLPRLIPTVPTRHKNMYRHTCISREHLIAG